MAAAHTTSNFTTILSARKNFYEFTHQLFSSPLDLNSLNSIKLFGNIEGLLELGDGGKALFHFFTKAGEDELKLEEIQFARLFIGPLSLPAPPWESFYKSRERLLFDDSMYEVRRAYHESGLKFFKENKEPDDHLLTELEFMIHLSRRSVSETEPSKLNDLFQRQYYFLDKQLGSWVPLFAEKLAGKSDSVLYVGAARLLADFITEDKECLKELMEGLAYVH
ncbi:TorD/DmsD family molecular chaperone [Bacillus sp. EB01]|uniref:TorD/DmsD family molecular chaperone n=1 Tax=Bacillus sp. EB01 TaxID=1347086 RepID=UPI0005C46CE6|nr:molecular chaperone TorD family protein [Bacillus sp. EB01]